MSEKTEMGKEAALELEGLLWNNENVKGAYLEGDYLAVVLVHPGGSIEGISSHYRNYPIVLRDTDARDVDRKLPEPKGHQTFEEFHTEILNHNLRRANLPDRFSIRTNGQGNGVFILDTNTGREMEVGLCECGGAYKAIRTFC